MLKSIAASKAFVLCVITGLVLSPLNATAQTVVKNADQATANRDVVLTPVGDLHGTITNGSGQPQAKVPVEIRHQGRIVSQASTDAGGHFIAHNLNVGSYDLQTPSGNETIRLWNASTAPPHATTSLTINDDQIVRGQYASTMYPQHVPSPYAGHGHGVPFGRAFKGGAPWLFGVGLAAAIALPIALSDDDDGTRLGDLGGDKVDAS